VNFASAGDLSRLGLNRLFFFFRLYRPFQSYGAVLRDDLHVVRSGGKRFIFHDCATDLSRELPVIRIFFLLLRRGLVLVAVPLIHFRVVGGDLGRVVVLLCPEHTKTDQEKDSGEQGSRSCFCHLFHLVQACLTTMSAKPPWMAAARINREQVGES